MADFLAHYGIQDQRNISHMPRAIHGMKMINGQFLAIRRDTTMLVGGIFLAAHMLKVVSLLKQKVANTS